MRPNELPFDAETMLAGLRTWVECESPTFDAAAVNRMMDIAARDLAMLGARIETIAGRMGFGDCVRARFPHPLGDAPGILVLGHMDTVHPVGTLDVLPLAPGRHQMLRARHRRHEGRQLSRARGDPPADARRRRDAASRNGAVHQRRGDRQPVDARPDRGGGRAASLRAGARAVPAERQRGERALRDRALQSRVGRTAEPCGRAPRRRPLRDPRHGAPHHRDRADDHGRLHLQRRRGRGRPMGELRRHRAAAARRSAWRSGRGPRPGRRAHARALRHGRRRRLHGDARRDPAGVGAG